MQGYEPGEIDGYYGHNTHEAGVAWLSAHTPGGDSRVDRTPASGEAQLRDDLPTRAQCGASYGQPGAAVKDQLVYVDAPYPMRLDWALDQRASRVRVHRLCAEPLFNALSDVRAHYGDDEIKRLGLDRYAGGHNHRRVRGGSSWSMHAYGCAIDIYAAPNGLRVTCPRALFCGPKYQPFLDIMEGYGWLPAIRLWGADAMHFQMARL